MERSCIFGGQNLCSTLILNKTPDALTNWKITGIANSILAPSQNNHTTQSAVDVAGAASYGFRKLDRFSAHSDWNASAKPATPQEYSRLVRVKKHKPKRTLSSRGTPDVNSAKSERERAALVSYLDLLMSSNADVEDEVGVVFELLVDSGCSKEEIAAMVEKYNGVSASLPPTPSSPGLQDLNM